MSGRRIELCRNKDGFIDLNKLWSYREKGSVVEGSNAKQWFNVDGTRFLFKEYSSVLPCFGEVLYYKAAKQCGVRCAKYDFASYGNKIGTISYDFLRKNEAYYNFLELVAQFGDSNFDINNIKSNYEMLVLLNNKYNNLAAIKNLVSRLFYTSNEEKNNIEKDLIKMFVLDTIFWHTDRTLWNYGTIVNEDSDETRFADVHDNSYVLCLNKGENYIEEMIVSFINDGVMNLSKTKVSTLDLIFDEDDSIDQLIEFYSNSDEEIRKLIDEEVSALNIEEIFEDTRKNCEIGDIPSLWIKAVLNFRQKTILRGLESVKINDDEARMPSVTFSKRK